MFALFPQVAVLYYARVYATRGGAERGDDGLGGPWDYVAHCMGEDIRGSCLVEDTNKACPSNRQLMKRARAQREQSRLKGAYCTRDKAPYLFSRAIELQQCVFTLPYAKRQATAEDLPPGVDFACAVAGSVLNKKKHRCGQWMFPVEIAVATLAGARSGRDRYFHALLDPDVDGEIALSVKDLGARGQQFWADAPGGT